MADQYVYAGLEPAELWRHFYGLNVNPRPSRHEGLVRAYVEQVAAAAGASHTRDERGNVVVRVPATPGRENSPTVAIQAHLDMVCEKRPDVQHDFFADPIRPQVLGDFVYASGTTLGADNGIGAAAALATLTTPGLLHGPLELIFTVEEEIGLNGARELDKSLVKARWMINLDSEDPRELTVGCAGGAGAILRLPLQWEDTPTGWMGREIVVSGLKGGHSGVQIHERLANAVKLLVRAVPHMVSIASVRGGNAHNAIPRDASALIALPPDEAATVGAWVETVETLLQVEWAKDEPGLRLEIREVAVPAQVLTADCRGRALDLLGALPHGVLAWSEAFAGKVETSSNLAQVSTTDSELVIATSTRSFVNASTEAVQQGVWAVGVVAGAEVDLREGYPGWEPNRDSRLLAVSCHVFQDLFGEPADVQVIHAGLECGVIVAKFPGMEAVSFGPRIDGAHTPEEHVHIPSVERTWRLLTGLLARLSQA